MVSGTHLIPIRIPNDMGMVWEDYHKGVPLLGVPGITLEYNTTHWNSTRKMTLLGRWDSPNSVLILAFEVYSKLLKRLGIGMWTDRSPYMP